MTSRKRRVCAGLCILALCGLAAWVFVGCGGPDLPLLESEDVIVAFGDSLTQGVGADQSEAYPAVLGELIGHPVVNAGVSGELSRQGLTRLPRVLDRYKPAIIIICSGGNDFLRGESEERMAENVRKMVEMAQAREIGVVLVGVPRPGLLLATAPCYEAIAADFDVPYEGQVLHEIMSSRPLKSDRVHPNAKGYRLLAEAVAEVLRDAGAVD